MKTLFGFRIPNLTEEERQVILPMTGDTEEACRAAVDFSYDKPDEIDYDFWCLGLRIIHEDGDFSLVIHDNDNSASQEDAVRFVKAFLAKFRPSTVVGFGVALTSDSCDGGCGGEAYFVSAEGHEEIDTMLWIATNKLHAKQVGKDTIT